MTASVISDQARAIAEKVERFVRETIVPYEKDPRQDAHGPTDALADEMKALAREAGVLTPHILEDGSHLTHAETALVLQKSGLSPLGPLACNTAAPDEGNMYLLGQVGSPDIQERFLKPLVRQDMAGRGPRRGGRFSRVGVLGRPATRRRDA